MQSSQTVDEKMLKQLDIALIRKLALVVKKGGVRTPFRSRELARLAKNAATLKGFERLQDFLTKEGAFNINLERRNWRDRDGETKKVLIARAATTEMWPMGTHYWIRDNAIIGSRLLFGPAGRSRRRGKEVLISALTIMSSVSQLTRFRQIISKSDSYLKDQMNWPHIFIGIKDNLNVAKKESWPHWQDAWQMLVYFIIEAIDRGDLSLKDLTSKHKKLIAYAVPFLCRIGFWKRETSGSWEEIAAVRSSVLVWDTLLVYRLLLASHEPGFEFLASEFKKLRDKLPAKYRKNDFAECASSIFVEGLKTLSKALPNECPAYPKTDVRYRTADAATIYLLQLRFPEFLAHVTGQSQRWSTKLEKKLLASIETLQDPLSGGFYRYGNDTYQACGFFRHLTVKKLSDLYGGPSGDASGKFAERGKVVLRGRKAAWVHIVWQLSAWAGRRFLETGDTFYLTKHTTYFQQGLGLITGKNEWSIEQLAGVAVRMIRIPAFVMPECYISDRGPKGEELTFPSPHTPLNWAIAEMADAFYVRRVVLEAMV